MYFVQQRRDTLYLVDNNPLPVVGGNELPEVSGVRRQAIVEFRLEQGNSGQP